MALVQKCMGNQKTDSLIGTKANGDYLLISFIFPEDPEVLTE